MELIPVHTKIIKAGDNLTNALVHDTKCLILDTDILAISSKAVATAEGRIIDLAKLTPSDDAGEYAEKCGRTPAFCQAVLEETKKRNGKVVGTCPGAIITELKPWQATSLDSARDDTSYARDDTSYARDDTSYAQDDTTMRTILTANAGLDESNAEEGTAIGWPEDPVRSVKVLRGELTKCVGAPHRGAREDELLPPHLAVIITDSCVKPRRWGVTAYALAVSGIDPLSDEAGKKDIFGRKLRITKEAVADQIATSANMLMGNAGQCVPAVIIRNHKFKLSDYEGWVPGIEPKEDLFHKIV